MLLFFNQPSSIYSDLIFQTLNQICGPITDLCIATGFEGSLAIKILSFWKMSMIKIMGKFFEIGTLLGKGKCEITVGQAFFSL